MRVLFDFEYVGDIELDSKIAQILQDAKSQLIELYKDMEGEMERDGVFIIFTWTKQFATIVVSAPESMAEKMYSRYDDYAFYTNLVKKYKTQKLN